MKKQQTRKLYKNPFIRRILVGLTGFILFLSLSGLPSLAQNTPAKFPFSNPQQQQPITTPKPPVAPAPTAPGLNDPQEFAAFIDNIFNEEISKSHVPGAIISVVKDGKLSLCATYSIFTSP